MLKGRPRWRSSKTRKKDEAAALKAKFRALRFGILILFSLLVAQLCRMQIVKGEEYRQRA
jgi:cell division protein FtsI/penicillin-binding protein 2